METPRYQYDDKVKMAWEKEVLGMYLSQHPLEKYGFQPLDSFRDGMVQWRNYDMCSTQERRKAFVHTTERETLNWA